MSRTSTIARSLATLALLGLVAAHEGHVHGSSSTEDMADMPGMSGDNTGGSDSTSSMAGMKMYMHGSIGDDFLWFKSWHPSGPGATVGVCIALFCLAVFDRYAHAMWRACNAHWSRGRVWFAVPVSQGAVPSYEDSGGVVIASDADARPASALPTFRSVARDQEKVGLEKAGGEESCCGGGVPEACNCGCGGECGQSSSPAYAAYADERPQERQDESRGLEKRGSTRAARHLPAAVASGLDPARVGRWSRPFRWSADLPRGLLWTFITALHYALMLVVMTYQIWWIISVVVGAGVGEMLFGRFGATR